MNVLDNYNENEKLWEESMGKMDLFGNLPEDETPSMQPFMTYMGAKTKPRRDILNCYPKNMTKLVSPFIGGGSLELMAAGRGVRVHGHDKYPEIVRLWNVMLLDAYRVSEIVYDIFPVDPEILKHFVKTGGFMQIEDDCEFAAYCVCASKQTFNGYFLNHTYFKDSKYPKNDSKFSGKSKYHIKYEKGSLMVPEDWKEWCSPNLSVDEMECLDTLRKYRKELLYCDPPYVGLDRYYGPYRTKRKHPDLVKEWTFDHEAFAAEMHDHENGFAISYIDHPVLREYYADFDVLFMKWAQGSVNSQRKRPGDSNNEILILKPPVSHHLARPYKELAKEIDYVDPSEDDHEGYGEEEEDRQMTLFPEV